MIEINLIKDFKTVGIDQELIRAIINRCIQQCLQEVMGIISDLTTLQYCPVWKRDRKKSAGKHLKAIRIRIVGEKIHHEIENGDLKKSGLALLEVYEYLKRSDAQKVTIR